MLPVIPTAQEDFYTNNILNSNLESTKRLRKSEIFSAALKACLTMVNAKLNYSITFWFLAGCIGASWIILQSIISNFVEYSDSPIEVYKVPVSVYNTTTVLYPADNMISSFRQCNINMPIPSESINEIWIGGIPPRLAYLHIFKSGGTSIIEILNQLLNQHLIIMNENTDDYVKRTLHGSDERIQWFLSKTVIDEIPFFTYIRSPLDRFLSGYFELKRRNDPMVDFGTGFDALETFRKFLYLIYNRYRRYRNEGKLSSVPARDIYHNAHLLPQMIFMTDINKNKLPLDYIGDISNLNETLPILIKPFFNKRIFMDADSYWGELQLIFNRRARNKIDKEYQTNEKIDGYNKDKHIDLSKWIISKEDLSDADIAKICELYAIDYICLFQDKLPLPCTFIKRNH